MERDSWSDGRVLLAFVDNHLKNKIGMYIYVILKKEKRRKKRSQYCKVCSDS